MRAVSTSKITIRLPADLWKLAKHVAIDQNVDVQDLVAEVLRRAISRKAKR